MATIIKPVITFIKRFIPFASTEISHDIEAALPIYNTDLQSIRIDAVEFDNNGNVIEYWTENDNSEFKTDNVFLMV
jgi:hypothetical protein